MPAAARRKIFWAVKRRALASTITLHDRSALESEIRVQSIRTVAIGASRLHWDHRVDAASQEGRAH